MIIANGAILVKRVVTAFELAHSQAGGKPYGMSHLPNRVREFRKQRGLTLRQLGDLVGLSDAQLSRLEKGERELSVSRLLMFAQAFRCPTADLLPEGADDHLKAEQHALPPSGFRLYSPSSVLDVKPWPIPLRETKAGYSPHGCLLFGADFLRKFQIDPLHCEVIEAHDSTMHPTVPKGSACLVDGRKTDLFDDALYAVERGGDLFVRRARERRDTWHYVADNDRQQTFADRGDVVIVGRVIWTARMVDFGLEDKHAADGIR